MISKLLFALEQSLGYIKKNPQIQFALLLIILLPLAFLYSGNAFLEAGRANQDKLQRDRVGLLHDSFASLLRATEFDYDLAQRELEAIVEQNPDITKFRIVEKSGSEFVVKAALKQDEINNNEENVTLYQTAAVRFDESLIFPFTVGGERKWQAVRAISDTNDTIFILTETSFVQVDNYLQSREFNAYVTLGFVYVLVLVIAYWHIRSTDYHALYTEAKKAVKTKDLFTNMIAHELRSPLTAIRGYASMLEEAEQITGKEKEYPDRIKASSERLLAIVNDLLDVARIQSGKLKVEAMSTELAPVVKAVIEELASTAQAKGLVLATEIPPETVVWTDPKRLHQVLTNIVSNSIKYTAAGTITVRALDKRKTVEIRVQDTGMGISAEDQQKLFAPFFRVQSDDVSDITGSGLGMWITRQFIELMAGTISVESIKNVGTHVVITFHKDQL